jgi:L-ascorbate metabolism protein UlaG (beta-lactamase superfamily)
MRPGDVWPFEGGRIVAVAAYHPGWRYSFSGSSDGRALGYIIEIGTHTLYYTGDSEYFEGFKQVHEAFHPDLVLLNINTHLRWHDAIQTVRDLAPQLVIPGHFGAYRGSNERKTPAYRGQLPELGSLWRGIARRRHVPPRFAALTGSPRGAARSFSVVPRLKCQ